MTQSPPPWPSLGLNLPYTDGSMDGATPRWSDILAMAQAAEDVGCDAIWVSDHVGFGDPEGEWGGAWECWTLLTALAVGGPARPAGHVRAGDAVPEPGDAREDGGDARRGVGRAGDPRCRRRLERARVRRRTGSPGSASSTGSRRGCGSWSGCSARGGRRSTASSSGRRRRGSSARGPRPEGLPVMVGAGGAADAPAHGRARRRVERRDVDAGRVPIEASARLDVALREVGRDPSTIRRSVEAMVRPGGEPPADLDAAGSGERPLTGLAGGDRRGPPPLPRARRRPHPGPAPPEPPRNDRGASTRHRAARRRLILAPTTGVAASLTDPQPATAGHRIGVRGARRPIREARTS